MSETEFVTMTSEPKDFEELFEDKVEEAAVIPEVVVEELGDRNIKAMLVELTLLSEKYCYPILKQVIKQIQQLESQRK